MLLGQSQPTQVLVRQERVPQSQRLDDPPSDLLAIAVPGDLLDDLAGQDVGGVGVVERGAGREVRLVRGADGDERLGRPVPRRVLLDGAHEVRVPRVREDARAMVQQHADGDLVPVREARLEPGQWIVEADHSLRPWSAARCLD